MLEVLFDTPWWLPVAFIGIGAALLVTGNNRQEKGLMRGGIAVLLGGILIAVVSYLVDTDTEKAVKRTRQLVEAVNKRDWPAFRALINNETHVYSLRGPDAITSTARSITDRTNVGNIRITGTDVKKSPTVINVNIRVLSDQLGTSGVTDWQLQFEDFGKGWVLYQVRLLPGEAGAQVPEERILRELSGQ